MDYLTTLLIEAQRWHKEMKTRSCSVAGGWDGLGWRSNNPSVAAGCLESQEQPIIFDMTIYQVQARHWNSVQMFSRKYDCNQPDDGALINSQYYNFFILFLLYIFCQFTLCENNVNGFFFYFDSINIKFDIL